jgi:recombination protein RecA
MFGNPETTTGGNALKFYASVRIDLRRVEAIKKGEEFVGNRIKAKIVKNKVAAPFKNAEFEIYFDEGISKISDIMDLGVKTEVIQKSGSWFSYEADKLGQGRDGVREFLQGNPKLLAKIEKQILEKAKQTIK